MGVGLSEEDRQFLYLLREGILTTPNPTHTVLHIHPVLYTQTGLTHAISCPTCSPLPTLHTLLHTQPCEPVLHTLPCLALHTLPYYPYPTLVTYTYTTDLYLLPGGSPPKLIYLSMKAASIRVTHCNVAEGLVLLAQVPLDSFEESRGNRES